MIKRLFIAHIIRKQQTMLTWLEEYLENIYNLLEEIRVLKDQLAYPEMKEIHKEIE